MGPHGPSLGPGTEVALDKGMKYLKLLNDMLRQSESTAVTVLI